MRTTSFLRLNPQENPLVRIFCFPHAGVGAYVFSTWRSLVPRNVEVVALQLPGRESRIEEQPFTSMEAVVDHLLVDMQELTSVPFVLFGYSLGSRIGYELVRHQMRRRLPLPKLLVAGASRAPHLPSRKDDIHELTDKLFIDGFAELGGTPQELLENHELMKVLLPAIRADFQLVETYKPEKQRLDVPIMVVSGADDPEVNHAEAMGWEDLTHDFLGVHYMPGNHFFIQDNHAQIITNILDWMQGNGYFDGRGGISTHV